eukprot:scaffold5531_cov75-Cyclotella_meneghiniana.AAC.2
MVSLTIVFFSLGYSDAISITDNFDKTSQIYHGNFLVVTNHASVTEYKNRVNRMHESDSVSLDQCFESFTQPERLDDDNKWYCSKCKEHVEAMKMISKTSSTLHLAMSSNAGVFETASKCDRM